MSAIAIFAGALLGALAVGLPLWPGSVLAALGLAALGTGIRVARLLWGRRSGE